MYPDPFSEATFEPLRKTLIPRFESGKGVVYLVTEIDGEEVCDDISEITAKRLLRELKVAVDNL